MIDIDKTMSCVETDIGDALAKFVGDHSLRLCKTAIHCSAQLQGEIVGVASAMVDEQTGFAKILVLYVMPMLRGLGIGTKLLDAIVRMCQEKLPSSYGDKVWIMQKCDSSDVDIDRFSRFLVNNSWPALAYDSSTLVLDMNKIPDCRFCKMGLVDEVFQLGNFSFRFMSDMSDEEFDDALQQACSIAPRFLQPAKNRWTVIPQLSCFVFDGDAVVAWASMLRLSETEIYAECIYVKEECRENNLAYLILHRMMKYTAIECPDVKRVHVGFDETDARLARFYRRIFEGCILSDYKTFVSIKTIK